MHLVDLIKEGEKHLCHCQTWLESKFWHRSPANPLQLFISCSLGLGNSVGRPFWLAAAGSIMQPDQQLWHGASLMSLGVLEHSQSHPVGFIDYLFSTEGAVKLLLAEILGFKVEDQDREDKESALLEATRAHM